MTGQVCKKDYPKYIAYDNEIVGGNESNMNYLMTIKKEEEDGRTINEDDDGYYEESTLSTKTLSLLLLF